MKSAYMNNKDLFLLNVIINHYEEVKIALFELKSIEDFLNNVYIRKSIILDIIQIGENVNKLSDEIKNKIEEKNLRGVISFRNFLVHQYGNIDNYVVWDTANTVLPVLIKELELIKKSLI